MNGCQTCGGFGMHHDPVAHNWAPAWATCPTCKGEQTVRDDNDLDVTCPECGHGPERHGPEAGGCIECRCTDLLADFAESLEQMRRGEGAVLREKPEELA